MDNKEKNRNLAYTKRIMSMLDRTKCIEILKSIQPYLGEKYGVRSMLLFGSLAKGEQKEGSDVDVCVDDSQPSEAGLGKVISGGTAWL